MLARLVSICALAVTLATASFAGHPVPELARFHGTSGVEGTSAADTLARFAQYGIDTNGQPQVGSLRRIAGPGAGRFEVRDRAGHARGEIVGRAPRFEIRDLSGRTAGWLSSQNTLPGELQVQDPAGTEVGALVDFSGNGEVLSLRGGAECAAIFHAVGVELVTPGQARQQHRFGQLFGTH